MTSYIVFGDVVHVNELLSIKVTADWCVKMENNQLITKLLLSLRLRPAGKYSTKYKASLKMENRNKEMSPNRRKI